MTFSIRQPQALSLLAAALLTTALPLIAPAQQPAAATNVDLLRGMGAFEKSYTSTPPWGGVDSGDYLRGFQETAPIVLSNGQVDQMSIPTSVAVADLNGDGLPDLIVADPSGVVWYYPNSGTPTEPKFTSGEVIPIWLRGFIPRREDDGGEQRAIACNKIFAADYNDDGKIDLIFGTFMGEVYFLQNVGSKTNPKFVQPDNPKESIVNTRSDGKLWGTFFAPIYVDFTKSNRRDLILGEGTYSANNIYYYPNAGTSASPRFSEKTRQVLVQGLGREHLTPQMVDWNNDGIPDIITGERDGSVTVFICKNNDPKKFEFAEPITVKFGSSSKLGSLSNPVPVDLNGDGLFDLVVGRTNGRVAVAYNKGKPGEPVFDMPVEIKGVQPYPKYLAPTGWTLDPPPQSTFHIFRLVTGQDPANLTGPEKDRATLGYEAGLNMSPNSTGKYCGKLEFLRDKSKYFTTQASLPADAAYYIRYDGGLQLNPDTNYEITLWVKGSGWTKTETNIGTRDRITINDPKTGEKKYRWIDYYKNDDFNLSGGWSKVTKTFRYTKDKETSAEDKSKALGFGFAIKLVGKGTAFYIDDVTITEKK